MNSARTKNRNETKPSKLSNDSKIHDPVEVFCRIKSLSSTSDTSCISLYSSTKIGFTPEALKNRKVLQYTFSYVFTEHADQKNIFDHVAKPLLNGLVEGEDGLLFSYGVTGSGKTYTMSGEKNNPGIVPRCINTLFNSVENFQTLKYLIKSDKLNGFEIQAENEALMERLQEAKIKQKMRSKQDHGAGDTDSHFLNEQDTIEDLNENLMYAVFITYIEIYNNNAYDLLDETAGTRSLQAKILREDSRRIVYVNNVAEIEVKSAQEALELYLLGNQRKRMGSTSLNVDSSRSHSIFNIRLVISPENFNENTDKNSLIISQLSLVDLAGSERCSRANTRGISLKEAGSINSSLMALRNCLNILRENQRTGQNKIVPYRDTRLTHMFKNYFEGEGKVKMIVCVNPSIKDFEETIYVLQFAEATQEVKIPRPESKIQERVETTDKVLTIIDEIQLIRAQLTNPQGSIPKVISNNPDNQEIKTLILYLRQRRKTLIAVHAIRRIADKFKTRLIETQDVQDKYDKEVQFLLPAERAKVKDLKQKLIQNNVLLEKAVEQCMEKDEKIKELDVLIGEKDFQLRRNIADKENYKQKIEQFSEKMTHELDSKLRRQRANYDAAIKTQSKKIDLIKDILTNNASSELYRVSSKASLSKVSKASQEVMKEPSNAQKVLFKRRAPSDVSKITTEAPFEAWHEVNKVSSEHEVYPEVRMVPSEISITASSKTGYNENISVQPNILENRIMQQRTSSHGHIARRGIPVANTRYRRSRSTGDVWLQHKPAHPVPLGTVLQPVIKTRKSVTKLAAMKDITTPKQSKYLLISQTADNQGALETRLYKGDIIPTCTGGAQVVFDDVERLKQESLRRSDDCKKRSN